MKIKIKNPLASFLCADSLQWLKEAADEAVDLIVGSPPYAGKGDRYEGHRRKWKDEDWIDWMFAYTQEAVRVSKGYVFWVVNGYVKDGGYHPVCEGLLYRCYQAGIICDRPVIWWKNAPPSRKDYFGNDWEYVLAFKHAAKGHTFNWEAIAQAPKYKSGGDFRQRNAKGQRVKGSSYPQGKLARPRDVWEVPPVSDVLRVTVGGGHMGSAIAHKNEALFPEKLVEPLIKVFTNPGDLVLDPFSGSGTTVAVAARLGRRGLGIDVRPCQTKLARQRLKTK